ncbi:hypothetical protein NMY22_g20085 [Coprinellus aureogranulatus]|nr:hypothetical protein NMY22_g20085 [Coprinellus aureogranulatus]
MSPGSTAGRPHTRLATTRGKATESGNPVTPTRAQPAAQATIDTHDAAIKVLKKARIIKKESEVQDLQLLVQALRRHSATLREPGQQSQLQASDIDAKIYDALATLIEEHANGYLSIQGHVTRALEDATAIMKQELAKGLEEIKESAAEAATTVKDTAQQVHNSLHTKANFPTPQTYSEAVTRGRQTQSGGNPATATPAEVLKIGVSTPASNEEIKKEEAQKALADMAAPESIKIRLVNKYVKSENLVIEMKDDESSDWIKTGSRADMLATKLGGKVAVPVHWNLVKFVPVEFDLGRPHQDRMDEEPVLEKT